MKNFSKILMIFIMSGIIFNSCQSTQEIDIVSGVSKEIAEFRTNSISNPNYDLSFSIPDSIHHPIQAEMKILLELNDVSQPLILDFSAPPEYIKEVVANGSSDFEMKNGHLIIPQSLIIKGKNEIHIIFRAGETSLNRNKEFLYTLFVPDRASTAFPCFDQPNMKAKYKLSLEIPKSWTAVSNAPDDNTLIQDDRKTIQFLQTRSLSTYLFSFVAGKFDRITRNIDGREINMLHREPDAKLVEKNVDEIFNLHAKALNWLEDYTQVDYPFQKFDFVAIPFFQYGGMEHAGAIQYRANSLFLEDNATQNQKLGRAGLISHETSHMWFGDYVTMKWFDDVWLKEVFAGFMSDKIIRPSFPDINHELKFLLGHYPAAYEIDRTLGANPIGQKLDNMKNAGTLYGGIIYNKAPIVMLHLEQLMGEDKLKEGLQEYLKTYAYADATWDQLIQILDKRIDIDLEKWSNIWVKEAGMPTIKTSIEVINDQIKNIHLTQSDPFKKGRIWPQQLAVEMFYNNDSNNKKFKVDFNQTEIKLKQGIGIEEPNMILLNSHGSAYGYFELDSGSKEYLLKNINTLESPLERGIAWLSLWENMLNENFDKTALFQLQLSALETETDPLLIGRILSQTSTIFWQFFSSTDREKWGAESEQKLWILLNQTQDVGLKKNYFNSYKSIALTDQALQNLYKIWEGTQKVKNLSLSDNDQTSLAYMLALKLPVKSQAIMVEQTDRISNPDRKSQIKFVAPALSSIDSERDSFFQSLKNPTNREQERWVVTALGYLNHPLRADYSIKYLNESLELLQEIQLTGDIFFPKQWLDAVLGGYQSKEAMEIVNHFLELNPNYSENLKGKILQSSDLLFRSQKIVTN